MEPPSTPTFCEQDALSGLLRQFLIGQGGTDSGLQADGLLAYYRRLGCSPEQLQAAMQTLQPGSPNAAATAQALGVPQPRALPLFSGRGQESVGEEVLPLGGVPQLQIFAWELLAAALAAAVLTAYQGRPRGWSRKDLLEVRQSAIEGRGVFSVAPIPRGTVLGAYPGRLRSSADMVEKCQTAPLAASYAFQTADGRFLDPTDSAGQPSSFPQPGWPWVPVDVTLSYVNEPPKGSPGTNAFVEDGAQPGDLLFVANVDLPAGAEILIDYGLTYDRSGYGKR